MVYYTTVDNQNPYRAGRWQSWVWSPCSQPVFCSDPPGLFAVPILVMTMVITEVLSPNRQACRSVSERSGFVGKTDSIEWNYTVECFMHGIWNQVDMNLSSSTFSFGDLGQVISSWGLMVLRVRSSSQSLQSFTSESASHCVSTNSGVFGWPHTS